MWREISVELHAKFDVTTPITADDIDGFLTLTLTLTPTLTLTLTLTRSLAHLLFVSKLSNTVYYAL